MMGLERHGKTKVTKYDLNNLKHGAGHDFTVHQQVRGFDIFDDPSSFHHQWYHQWYPVVLQEILVRMVAARCHFWCDPWNIMDLCRGSALWTQL